jgi:hypothetical protein
MRWIEKLEESKEGRLVEAVRVETLEAKLGNERIRKG